MQKWEYAIIQGSLGLTKDIDALNERLQKMGSECWEAVGFTSDNAMAGNHLVILLKRPVK